MHTGPTKNSETRLKRSLYLALLDHQPTPNTEALPDALTDNIRTVISDNENDATARFYCHSLTHSLYCK